MKKKVLTVLLLVAFCLSITTPAMAADLSTKTEVFSRGGNDRISISNVVYTGHAVTFDQYEYDEWMDYEVEYYQDPSGFVGQVLTNTSAGIPVYFEKGSTTLDMQPPELHMPLWLYKAKLHSYGNFPYTNAPYYVPGYLSEYSGEAWKVSSGTGYAKYTTDFDNDYEDYKVNSTFADSLPKNITLSQEGCYFSEGSGGPEFMIVVVPANGDWSKLTGGAVGGSTAQKPSVTLKGAKDEILLGLGINNASVWGESKSLDVAPAVNKDNRTLVPLRFVSENLGCKVDWDGATQTVTVTKEDGATFNLVINQIPAGFDSPAIIMDGRTMVPIRYISQNLGYTVNWDGATRQIHILK